MPQIDTSPEKALEIFAEIERLEGVIDAASGSPDAGKRKIGNELAEANKDSYAKSLENLVSGLTNIEDPAVKAGVYTGLVTGLREALGKEVDEYLTKEADSRKTDSPEVSADELTAAVAARKEQVDIFKAMKALIGMFDEEAANALPEPKRMTGPRGPQGERGPRWPKNLQFAIDGKDRSATQNSLSSIFATVVKGSEGCESLTSTKDFKEFLAEKGVTAENVPNTFEVELPNGKTLSGRLTDDVVEDEEEEEEEQTEE